MKKVLKQKPTQKVIKPVKTKKSDVMDLGQSPCGCSHEAISSPKGESKMVVILLVITLIAIVGLSFTLWQNTQIVNQMSVLKNQVTTLDGQLKTYQATLNSEPEGDEVNTQSSNENVYWNSQYGFQLSLPESWTGYMTKEVAVEGTEKIIYFGLQRKNPDMTQTGFDRSYNSPFAISVFTKAEWDDIQGNDLVPIKISENDQYVFAYTEANGILNLDAMTDRDARASVPTIIQSFRLR